MALRRDVTFLVAMGTMDYSLLLGSFNLEGESGAAERRKNLDPHSQAHLLPKPLGFARNFVSMNDGGSHLHRLGTFPSLFSARFA